MEIPHLHDCPRHHEKRARAEGLSRNGAKCPAWITKRETTSSSAGRLLFQYPDDPLGGVPVPEGLLPIPLPIDRHEGAPENPLGLHPAGEDILLRRSQA